MPRKTVSFSTCTSYTGLHQNLGLSEAEVRKELAELEAARLAKGGIALHKTTAVTFLTLGLELEESQ